MRLHFGQATKLSCVLNTYPGTSSFTFSLSIAVNPSLQMIQRVNIILDDSLIFNTFKISGTCSLIVCRLIRTILTPQDFGRRRLRVRMIRSPLKASIIREPAISCLKYAASNPRIRSHLASLPSSLVRRNFINYLTAQNGILNKAP